MLYFTCHSNETICIHASRTPSQTVLYQMCCKQQSQNQALCTDSVFKQNFESCNTLYLICFYSHCITTLEHVGKEELSSAQICIAFCSHTKIQSNKLLSYTQKCFGLVLLDQNLPRQDLPNLLCFVIMEYGNPNLRKVRA